MNQQLRHDAYTASLGSSYTHHLDRIMRNQIPLAPIVIPAGISSSTCDIVMAQYRDIVMGRSVRPFSRWRRRLIFDYVKYWSNKHPVRGVKFSFSLWDLTWTLTNMNFILNNTRRWIWLREIGAKTWLKIALCFRKR